MNDSLSKKPPLLLLVSLLPATVLIAECSSNTAPEGIYPAQPAQTTVRFDLFHKPLPEIPYPYDVATRPDRSSATKRRINASQVAPTEFERRTRELIDELDGWGTMQPISIPFTGPIDIDSIVAGHRDADYDTSNDVIYLINIDRDSDEFGQVHHLDLGEGNYPTILAQPNGYGPNDPRADTLSLLFEEGDEDLNGNGVLDPGEDTDADGVLDVPNYLPGADPAPDDLAARADALMGFYERETNTVIAWPLVPLRERTTYVVVVTRRLLDEDGLPVGSPFEWIHHIDQTPAMEPLPEVIEPLGLELEDVAFAFTYTTQSVEAPMIAVRDGLYGHGIQAHLGEEFPPDVHHLFPLRDARVYPDSPLHILPGETWEQALHLVNANVTGDDTDTYAASLVLEGQRYVDYFVIGSFDSPQLFERTDEEGEVRPYNDQVWPADLDRVRATAVRQTLNFTLAVPRREVSVRGDGQPAPVVILLHGHGGQRFTAMQWSAYFCKFGLALLSIDGPGHGIETSEMMELMLEQLMVEMGLNPAITAILSDRSLDENDDGTSDSGIDFWTAYMFHTRDMVRQFTLDTMQLVRVLRGFDGTRRWSIDVDGDGVPDVDGLAGDFDGDGVLDVGGDAQIYVSGGSLGGMMTMVMGSLEPEVTAIAPLVGGGALASIGIRSTNGGAKVGFMLRSMAPIYLGTTDEEGTMVIETLVPDLIDQAIVQIAETTGVEPGDTLVVENLANGARGCGLVDPAGRVRAAVASDVGDPTRFVFYRGPVQLPGLECEVASDAEEVALVENFSEAVRFQGRDHDSGSQIVALAQGLAQRRGSPSFRRLQGIGQLVLDAGDPASFARHLQLEPLEYPGTGQRTGAHASMLFTIGDTSVPNSSGMVFSRAAGLLEYLEPDPRYGVPPNQVLLDNYIAEGVHNIGRFWDSNGRGVLIDIENFSGADDVWAEIDLPRLDPPLNLGLDETDRLGGMSSATFAMTDPVGDHGFAEPGSMIDDVREACAEDCPEPGTCDCETLTTYDVGLFCVNMLGSYLASGGQTITTDICMSRNDCPDFYPYPEVRTGDELP